jgi:hypothetical protein
MCENCTTHCRESDCECAKCGATGEITVGATFIGGTKQQAGGQRTTDCGACGHTMDDECQHANTRAVTKPIGGGETITVATLCLNCGDEV